MVSERGSMEKAKILEKTTETKRINRLCVNKESTNERSESVKCDLTKANLTRIFNAPINRNGHMPEIGHETKKTFNSCADSFLTPIVSLLF
jgi:hypothetical protein